METPFRGRRIDRSRDNVCLVTGATGFIGSHLAERLVRDGYQVRCLVRPTSDTTSLNGLDVELATGDLTSAHSLARAVEGCRYVFHCGAMVSDWATPKEVSRVNVEGTRELLSASAAASVRRVVHFSSTDVYGYPGGFEIDETYTATGFRNWYAQTKLAGRGRGPPVRGDARPRHGDPAARDRLRAALQGGRARDRARDPRRQHGPDRQRPGDRGPLLRGEPGRRRDARHAPRRRARAGVQRHRRSRHHLA